MGCGNSRSMRRICGRGCRRNPQNDCSRCRQRCCRLDQLHAGGAAIAWDAGVDPLVGVGREIGGSVGTVGSWALPGAGEEDVAETGAAGTSAAKSVEGTGGADVAGTSVAKGAVRMSAADADGAVVVDVAAVVGADKGAGVGAGAVAARGAGAAVEIADAAGFGEADAGGADAEGDADDDVCGPKRLLMPSTKSDQDGSPWFFSRWKYHWAAAPSR